MYLIAGEKARTTYWSFLAFTAMNAKRIYGGFRLDRKHGLPIKAPSGYKEGETMA